MRSRRSPEGPRRTCVGCRRVAAPHELVRLASTPDGVGIGRTLPGRGAWLCPDVGCLDRAIERGTLARALRVERAAVDPTALRRSWLDEPGPARTG